jgi:hypothetical protein
MGAFNFEPLGHVRRIGARLEVRPVPLLGLDDGLAVAIGRRLFSLCTEMFHRDRIRHER